MNATENKHRDLVGKANDAAPSIYKYVPCVTSKNKYWIKLNLELDHWITVAQN